MLKQRIFTIAVAAPIFIILVLYSSHAFFSYSVLLLLMFGAYEWAALSSLSTVMARLSYVGLFTGLAAVLMGFDNPEKYRNVLYAVTLLWWLIVIVWLFVYQRNRYVFSSRALKLLMGLLTLLPPWYALTELHAASANGPAWVLFLFLMIWAADIGAYIVGRLFGRTKLAAAISPGKTLEGVGGGLLAAALTIGAAFYYFDPVPLMALILLGMATAALSVVGDLFESLMKRMAAVKDSGSILPGHGGVLDRIDSMTIAAPVFVFGCFYWIF